MHLRKSALALTLAAAFMALPSAQAAVYTFTGDTTGKPTFTRPVEDLSVLSSAGAGVLYDTFSFTASTAGAYTFVTVGSFDTFSILYGPSFSPSSGLTNALIANDDAPDVFPFTTSTFTYSLAVGSPYTLVTTGFQPTDFGAYRVTIDGPGTIIGAVPEPETYALMALGLGAIYMLRRRGRSATA